MARCWNSVYRVVSKTTERKLSYGFKSHSSYYMDKNIVFKDLMHVPMIIEGQGNVDELNEIIGENNTERLKNLGVITINHDTFSVTNDGKKVVEMFNR